MYVENISESEIPYFELVRRHKSVLEPIKPYGRSLAHEIFTEMPVDLKPGEMKRVSTGFKIREFLGCGSTAVFVVLSELSNIYNNYMESSGEWFGVNEYVHVDVINRSNQTLELDKDDRNGCMVALQCSVEPLEVVDSLEVPDRGVNGFGSTGQN